MADNVTVDNGTGTDYVVATDDDGTAQHAYVKLEYGADGTFTKVASGANALPIQDGGNSITVDGSVTANAGTNLNTSALALETGGNLAGAATSLALIDDAVVADDAAFTPATTKVVMAGYEFDDTSPDSVNEGDAGAARMSANRNVYTTIRDAAGNERGVNVTAGNALTVDGSAVTQPVSLAALPNEGQQTMANSISVAVASDQSVVPSGGNVAHDAVDSGNPLKVGAKAIAHGTNPTAVAAADRTDFYANRAGVQFVIGGHPNSRVAVYNSTGAQTNDGVLAAISTGLKYVVTRISVVLDADCTVTPSVLIGFGASTLPALGASAADGVEGLLISHPGLSPGGGITIGDGSGIVGIGGDGEELRITCDAPTTGRIDVSVTFYTIES